ncbi:putative sporulation protein YtxC [Bacillus sp. M6-12]|nr:putative sporulation protein YtxC [Bacillus sp. M6-12]
MVHIHFQTETEAFKLLEYVSVHPLGTELNPYIQFQPERGLVLHIKQKYMKKLLALLSDVFYRFLLEDKLLSVLESIVRQRFYFREQEEVDSIVEIACSIIEGEQHEKSEPAFNKEREIIREGLKTFLADKVSFSFDSFATFRLKSFYDSLLEYVELAIDEYKLEQDYQSFIAALRDFLHEREPKMDNVHLLHSGGFHFYDGQFRKLGKQEIHKMIDRKLLADNPVYVDSTALAPLLSIAPRNLHLYTDEAEDGLIQTITRIFEERTVIRPTAAFKGV